MSDTPILTYKLHHVSSQSAIDISLRFKGNPSGTTLIQLPNPIPDEKLYEGVQDLTARGDVKIRPGKALHEKILHHAPGQIVLIIHDPQL